MTAPNATQTDCHLLARAPLSDLDKPWTPVPWEVGPKPIPLLREYYDIKKMYKTRAPNETRKKINEERNREDETMREDISTGTEER